MSKRDDVVIEFDERAKSEHVALREVVASSVVARIKRPSVAKVKPIAPKPKRKEVMPWEQDEVLAERDRRIGEANRRWLGRRGYGER